MTPPLTLHRQGNLAVLHLDDGRGNALSTTMLEGLQRALTDAAAADALYVRGRDKVFCGGLDLAEVVPKSADELATFLVLFDTAFERLLAFARPVVMAVHGSAIAGGAILLACGDERLGARDAGKVGVNEVRLGIPFPASAREAVRAGLGDTAGSHAMLTGDVIGKDEALRRGWFHALHEPQDLDAVALERAHALATIPSIASSLVKQALRAPHLQRIRDEGPALRALFADAWRGSEAQARLGRVLLGLKKA
jgi:enoyl-CoA hydratase